MSNETMMWQIVNRHLTAVKAPGHTAERHCPANLAGKVRWFAQGLRRVERLRDVRQAVVVHCKSGVAVRIYAMIHLSGGMGGLSSAVLTVYSLFAEE